VNRLHSAFPKGGNQNFKLVPWEAIANAIGLQGAIDTSRPAR